MAAGGLLPTILVAIAHLVTTLTTAAVSTNVTSAVDVDTESATLFIEVASANNATYVKVNGIYVHFGWAGGSIMESGLQLLVLNQATGRVMAKRFNSGHFEAGYVDMMEFLQRVQDGRIIIFYIQSEGAFSLGPQTRRYFSQFGHYFSTIVQRSRYAMIARKGVRTYAEGHVKWPRSNDHKTPLIVTGYVPVEHKSGLRCDWPDKTRARQRTLFCEEYEGFGGLCNCTAPDPLEYTFRPLLHNRTFNNPIAILGSNRGTYMYRMLQTLLPNRGLNFSMVSIFLQDYYPEIVELASLLNIRVSVATSIAKQKGAQINMNLKNAVYTSFNLFPQADKLVVLEDDLYVSPDFVSFFAQTAPLLDMDPSLYCVSAWNDLSYRHSSRKAQQLYRTSFFPGLGWMMKKSVLLDEMMPNWLAEWSHWDWDMWFRTEELTLNRECAVPDVSRTYHFAYQGGHVYSSFQHNYYSDKALNTIPDVEITDVSSTTYPKYREKMYKLFKGARFTANDRYYRDCFEMFPPTDDPQEMEKPYLLYFEMNHSHDWQAVQNVMTCFGLWDLDVRGEHQGTWRFYINGNPIIAIGIPFSEYASEALSTTGVSPVFDFKKRDFPRERIPATDGGNPPVITFALPDEYYEDYDDGDDDESVRDISDA